MLKFVALMLIVYRNTPSQHYYTGELTGEKHMKNKSL